MKLTVDNKQRLTTAFLFILESYKIVMGTFLTIFVPQECNQETCTILQNIQNNTLLHRIATISNLISFIVFIVFYSIELKRENWCIKYLDIDDNKASNNLDTEIELYKDIKSNMNKINKHYKIITNICIGTQIINISISIADILHQFNGISTITPLLSYVILIAIKLIMSFNIAYSSLKDERAYSSFMKISKTYNTIDDDFKHKNNV
jgi:hypothetical protein